MLRLDDDNVQQHLQEYHSLNPDAAVRQQGLLFRSPTLCEDVIKTILLCNCGWTRTVSMAKLLCEKLGSGAFPTPAQVAAVAVTELQQLCGLGYRAAHIHKLATQITTGALDLSKLDLCADTTPQQLYKQLLVLPGIGPFGACNLMQVLGHYEMIPCDTETVRHLQAHHNKRSCTLANVKVIAQEVHCGYTHRARHFRQ
jgi:3-methyladenine DNA glycosylase/8-oxoguanine DNA glycosylase